MDGQENNTNGWVYLPELPEYNKSVILLASNNDIIIGFYRLIKPEETRNNVEGFVDSLVITNPYLENMVLPMDLVKAWQYLPDVPEVSSK